MSFQTAEEGCESKPTQKKTAVWSVIGSDRQWQVLDEVLDRSSPINSQKHRSGQQRITISACDLLPHLEMCRETAWVDENTAIRGAAIKLPLCVTTACTASCCRHQTNKQTIIFTYIFIAIKVISFSLYAHLYVFSCTCYILNMKICILLVKWRHCWEMWTFLGLRLELGWG